MLPETGERPLTLFWVLLVLSAAAALLIAGKRFGGYADKK